MISRPGGRRLIGRILRQAAYPLAALPVDVGQLVLLLIRRPPRATAPRPDVTTGAVLLRLPLDAVAFVIAAYVWLLLPVNWAFPLRPDVGQEPLRDTWGGPTLAGAWAVHALGATLAFLVVGLPLLNGLAHVQQRWARRTER